MKKLRKSLQTVFSKKIPFSSKNRNSKFYLRQYGELYCQNRDFCLIFFDFFRHSFANLTKGKFCLPTMHFVCKSFRGMFVHFRCAFCTISRLCFLHFDFLHKNRLFVTKKKTNVNLFVNSSKKIKRARVFSQKRALKHPSILISKIR